MPLFKCSKCGALENTALGNYWMPSVEGRPVLCSECDQGKWHGLFDKTTPEAEGLIECDDGFYYLPEEIAPGGYFAGRRVARPPQGDDHD